MYAVAVTILFKEGKLGELEDFFDSITLPTSPVKLNNCTTILDVSKFINSHLSTIKSNNGNLIYKPYLSRLQEIKSILENY